MKIILRDITQDDLEFLMRIRNQQTKVLRQNIRWMYDTINNELKQLFYGSEAITKELSILEKEVISSKISPLKAANHVIDMFKKRL